MKKYYAAVIVISGEEKNVFIQYFSDSVKAHEYYGDCISDDEEVHLIESDNKVLITEKIATVLSKIHDNIINSLKTPEEEGLELAKEIVENFDEITSCPKLQNEYEKKLIDAIINLTK